MSHVHTHDPVRPNAFVVHRGALTSIGVLSTNLGAVIGHIARNEFFRFNRNITWDMPHTSFVDQWSEVEFARNGQMLRGFVELPLWRNWSDSEMFLTDVRSLRLSQATATINGVQRTLDVFQIQNRVTQVVRRDGTNPRNLSIGTFIGVEQGALDGTRAPMGNTLRHFWHIRARTIQVSPGSPPQWVPIYPQYTHNNQTVDDGFVDTGLLVGNMPNTLSIRTSLSTV